MNDKTSFVIGWNYGKRNCRELTAHEIAVQFPDVQPDSFAQGNVDGMVGDRFRLDVSLAAWNAATTADRSAMLSAGVLVRDEDAGALHAQAFPCRKCNGRGEVRYGRSLVRCPSCV